MNKDTALDYLPLVQALIEGKTVQYRLHGEKWSTGGDVDFSLPPDQYRIKPEPKEYWANRYADGYETAACFLSKSQAENAANGKNVKQICYREVIE